MNTFVPEIIHSVDPDTHELNERYDVSTVAPVDINDVTSGIHEPFWCTGIDPLDLVVRGAILNDNGVEPAEYLVSSYTINQSFIIPTETVELDPRHYLTREMAKRIVTLSELEAAQLHLDDAVFRELATRFPGLQPFTAR